MSTSLLSPLDAAMSCCEGFNHQGTMLMTSIADRISIVRDECEVQVEKSHNELHMIMQQVDDKRLFKRELEKDVQLANQHIKQVNIEKDDLMKEIVAGNGILEQMNQQLLQVDQDIQQLAKQQYDLKQRWNSEIPSYKFLKNVYRKVSNVSIVKADRVNLEGLVRANVATGQDKDVVAFRYRRDGDNTQMFQRVNDLWDKINA